MREIANCDDYVTYQTWDSPLRINTGVEAFADVAYKEVPCPEKFGNVGVMNPKY